MNAEQVAALATADAQSALAELAANPLSEADVLPVLERLRRTLPAPVASAVVETSRLRQKAVDKFEDPHRMFFDREALEQSTAWQVARHRAVRFGGADLIVDLGCGIGGDARELAAVAPVVGVDVDRSRLMMARHNTAVLDRVMHPVQARSEDVVLDGGMFVFADPARRSAGRRTFDPDAYLPPLDTLLDRGRRADGMAVKVAPGIDRTDLPAGVDVEFVSLHGAMREAVLWTGDLRDGHPVKATILPAGVELTGDPTEPGVVRDVGSIIVEPDPAVIRAGLVTTVAAMFGLTLLDPDIAYLSGETTTPGAYGSAYRVREVHPFNLKVLRSRMRDLRVGSVTIKKRGTAVVPEEIRRRLPLEGDEEIVVILTRVAGAQAMILADAVRE